MPRLVGEGESEPVDGAPHRAVGLGHAGERGDHLDRTAGGDDADEAGGGRREVLREVHEHGAEVAEQGGSGPDRRPRGGHQVRLLVPVRGEPVAHRVVEPHDVAGTAAPAGERGEAGGAHLGQLAVDPQQRLLRRGVLADRREDAGLGRERSPDGGRDHRGRGGAAALRREGGGAEQLGQPVHREQGQPGDADAAAAEAPERPARQRPPHRDAEVVRRHHHGDGRERVVGLHTRDAVGQQLRRRAAVRGDGEGRLHRFQQVTRRQRRRTDAACNRPLLARWASEAGTRRLIQLLPLPANNPAHPTDEAARLPAVDSAPSQRAMQMSPLHRSVMTALGAEDESSPLKVLPVDFSSAKNSLPSVVCRTSTSNHWRR